MRIANPWPVITSRVGRFYHWTGFGEKKLIDYIQLIVLPFVLILGGQLVSQAVNASSRAQALEQAQEQRLQEYLDQMATLALDRNLLNADAEAPIRTVIREVARAQTLTALESMDGSRKRFVVTFLYELGLINGNDAPIRLNTSDLIGADLSSAELFAANLSGARLASADLSRARLTFAVLNDATLNNANLQGALLVDTRLNQADLRLANLAGTDASNASMFHADLRGADLTDANLSGANLRSADLRGADLSGADLSGADLTGALMGDDESNEVMFTEVDEVTWSGTRCPDATVPLAGAVDADGGGTAEAPTCASHLVPVSYEATPSPTP